ncbi:phosphoribosyltransferase [Streptomyces sp. W1SF4]|uniref:phosphoribosyltransferase n=1 Tax=Streptomyces sp. W1SF4 TaxID=2305220 RepID=UPI000F6EAC59|nr:phosphoribosyltransferase [Streptomyces sp. W1SF4]AZM90953.1 phosphoribosyltransferase [Streptomyces sp. W1SF4]
MSDLLDAVDTAHGNIERLADPGALRDATEQVMAVARQHGTQAILAASPVAERLVGALLSSYSELVSLSSQTALASQNVLIVDVNLASGTTVAQAARHARSLGVRRVHAVVLHQLTSVAAQAADCGVDVLDVLGERPPACPSSTTDSGLW